jgi:hypothetical protein
VSTGQELGNTIESLARQHGQQVLAEALQAARSAATRELTGQLTAAILAAAVAPHRPSPPEVVASRGLCVYAITRDHELVAGTIPALRGASPPRLIARDGLSLVVADVELSLFADLAAEPAEGSSLATLARAHDTVVRAVFEHGPVLPLRFGTIVSDENAARQLLDSRHDEVSSWLDRMAGHREWGVRVVEPTAVEKPAGMALDSVSGTEYLRRRQQVLADDERSRRNQVRATQSLHTALSGHASDYACRDHRPNTLLDAAYLVPHDNEALFQDQTARLSVAVEQLGASVHATGPWPPYSFTRIELAVEG